jgi:hypothetical protein
MSHSAKEIKEFKLSGTENGKIEVAIIQEPYGEGSNPVASIGVFLESSNSEPDWKVHIPKENIDEVIEALKEAKKSL